MTELLVQLIVCYLCDSTWNPKFNRRKPVFFIGSVLSTIALFLAPYSSALWMAAGLHWVLDASINMSIKPFRALVADKLHCSWVRIYIDLFHNRAMDASHLFFLSKDLLG
jgi:maltose/moltooligosaccharide transporter